MESAKRLLFALPLVVGFGLAQGPASNAPQASATGPSTVIRIDVNLVQVDAVVTDSHGKRVTDLKPSDFEILQDGKPQSISNFSYVTTKPAGAVPAPVRQAAQPKAVKGEPQPPPVPPSPAAINRTMALVVDDLGLAGENIPRVRDAIHNFLDQQMRPGDLVAIVRTSAGMGSLQQFTTDKRLLYAALERVKYGQSLNRVGMSSFTPLGSGGRADATVNRFREWSLEVGSLAAVRFVVNSMGGLPGRKSVVLFTESTRVIFRGASDGMVADAIQQLNDAASRAMVVIHSVDPRGLVNYNATAADRAGGRAATRVAGRRQQQVMDTEQGMTEISEASGGLFLDENDLTQAVREAAEDSDGYYLIGYRPDPQTFEPERNGKPRFHSLDVKVKQAGLSVRSRDGFFGEPSGGPAVERTREAEIVRALQSPFAAAAIHPRLTAVFSTQPQIGSFIGALLYFDPRELKWSIEPDGQHKAKVDLAAAAFDADGVALSPVDSTYTLQFNQQQYDGAMKKGLSFAMRVPVGKPGPYLVRAALRDPAAEGSGSAQQFVEVPDLANGRLALSGIVLSENGGKTTADLPQTSSPGQDSTGGAARRIFRNGAAVTYGYQVLNARTGPGQQPELETQTRLFRDGKQVFAGNRNALPAAADASDPRRRECEGVLTLGSDLPPGQYVLQVIVTDKLAKGSSSTVTQSTDFEIEK